MRSLAAGLNPPLPCALRHNQQLDSAANCRGDRLGRRPEVTMFGAQTLDHFAFPVRDLPRAEKFYTEIVGLQFVTQRKNADGSPRHTYVKGGENIIGLNLPGIQAEASPSGAPRYGIAINTEPIFRSTVERIKEAGVV